MRRRRDTGPSRQVRELVLARDGLTCVCCGQWTGWSRNLQHRKARGMGGTTDPMANSPVNLLNMTPECHQRVERRGTEDHAKGYWLRQDEDPAMVPVMVFLSPGCGDIAWPTVDGHWVFEAPAGVAS